MVKIFSITIILSALMTFGFAQTATDNLQISKVENGLLANAEVIFADSPVAKFNINDRMKFYKVPSTSIAVINNGKIDWAKSYGFADVNDKKTADVNTMYQAASVSKSVNAFFIMKLVEEGKLSLTKDIRQYLKTWTLPENEFSKTKTITIKDLLSHSAGLSTSGFIGYSKNDTIPTINEILDGKKPANSEAVKSISYPGTTLKYSGGGITLIRKILDDNISSNYDSLLMNEILNPLKMNNSSFLQPLNSSRKNYATAYDAQMQEVKGKYNIYPEQAPDGLWTTATDLAKFIISIQESINNKPGCFLKNTTVKEMLTPFPDSSDAALGFFIKEKSGEKYFTHSGANVGYRSDFYGSFSKGNGIVILTNSDNGQDLINEIINSVATVYNWKGFYNPIVKKLVVVPDTLLNKYAGEYVSENPSIKIIIVNKNGELELTARRPEKMYATGSNTFFLMSSPSQNAVFTSSKNDGVIDKFEVKQGTNILIKAIKK